MRVLLDEDLDVRLRHHFGEGVEVVTVEYRGWKGLTNGRLLSAAEAEFDVLVTADDSLPAQQNLAKLILAVVILRPRSKALPDLVELMPQVTGLLPRLRPGDVVRVFPPNLAET
jgi:hypothetical protein